MKSWNIDDESFNRYIESCIEASINEESFKNFKRNINYTSILEHQHIPKEYGDLLSRYIENRYDKGILLGKISKIQENDKYGNPILYDFEYGKLSLGTLRYIKNSCDIVHYFGDEINNICEIGGGYGGLCKTLSNFIDFKNYYLYDLEEVNNLSSKYLAKFDINANICISTIDNSKQFLDGEIDLLISNYAFSELSNDLQFEYIEHIVSKSKRFYMVYNHLQIQNGFKNGLNLQDFCNLLSDKYEIEIENDVDSDVVKIIYGKSKQIQ